MLYAAVSLPRYTHTQMLSPACSIEGQYELSLTGPALSNEEAAVCVSPTHYYMLSSLPALY